MNSDEQPALRCAEVVDWLDDLSAEDLADGEAPSGAALRAHLRACLACRRQFARAVAARRALRDAAQQRRDAFLVAGGESSLASWQSDVVRSVAARGQVQAQRSTVRVGRSGRGAVRTRRLVGAAALFVCGLGLSHLWLGGQTDPATGAAGGRGVVANEAGWPVHVLAEGSSVLGAPSRSESPSRSDARLMPVARRSAAISPSGAASAGLGAQRAADEMVDRELTGAVDRVGDDPGGDDPGGERASKSEPRLHQPVLRKR